HAVRACVSASRRERVNRMMKRLDTTNVEEAGRIVRQNDEAAQAVMRRHFHIDVRDINEYDIGFNTDRMSVAQCTDEILKMVKSQTFAETDESRAKLRDVAIGHHVRAALRTHEATAHCWVRVSAKAGRVTLEGNVESREQVETCAGIASRIKGVAELDNCLRAAPRPRGAR
ncbi:MAG TPA: BON domain-containing protein, partial [Burkholderiales bacterium]|nr:BON domain-containing protein [Burkholderiales bacterium]